MDNHYLSMDIANYLRGLGRGLTADVVGTPADIATQATNLGIAGGGYLAHKLGLVQTPPDLLDPTNVPLTSDWFVKNTPLQGEGTEYNLGRMTPAIVSMGRAALNPELTSTTTQALRSPSPAKQLGALYIGKDGEPDAEDLALYHNTMIGSQKLPVPDRYRVPQELRNVSQAITARGGKLVGEFGPNFLVPNPAKFEPRASNTVLKPTDFFTPRRDAATEGNYETVLAALRDAEVAKLHDNTLQAALDYGFSKREANRLAMDAATREAAKRRAQARLADRALGQAYPAGGSFGEVIKPQPSATALKQVLPAQYAELVASSPTFKSFEQFDTSPMGGDRLRHYAATKASPEQFTKAAEDFVATLKNMGYDLGSDPRFGTLQNPKYVAENVTLNGNRLAPKSVDRIVTNMQNLVNQVQTGPSQYAELKKYGPTSVIGANFPAFIYSKPVDDMVLEALKQKGIKPYDFTNGGKSKDVFDLMTRIQTNALRGQPLP